MEKTYLTTKEIAPLLKVSISTLKNWVRGNKIPYYRFGRKILFEEKEINTWMEEQKHPVK
jgi:excisionase family DNA binding protein